MRTPVSPQGFSLIEVILVIGLLGLIVQFGLVMHTGTLIRSRVTSERTQFLALVLLPTRSDAQSHRDGQNHGIFIDRETHTYIRFRGDSYDPTNALNMRIPFTSPHLSVTNDGGDTILFEAPSGRVTKGSGHITIQDGTYAQTLELYENGALWW